MNAKEILVGVALIGTIAFGMFVVYGPEVMVAIERVQKGQYPFELEPKPYNERMKSSSTSNFVLPSIHTARAGYSTHPGSLSFEEEQYEPWALQH